MFISIVIPTRNRPALLAQCLEPVAAQLRGAPGEAEVLVVDDGSSPADAEKNRGLCDRAGFAYHATCRNRGMAIARNVGIEKSRGEWVVFIDDDFRVDDDWFSIIVPLLKNAPGDVAGFEGKIEAAGSGLWDREVRCTAGHHFLTCHLALRKRVLEAAGGFDPRFEFEGPFHEDHELAARVLRHGDIVFEPSLSGTHLPRRMRLFRYLLSSIARASQILAADHYFFRKQPDRYHRFRHSRTFWGTYRSFLLRNVVNNLARRRPSDCLRRPMECAVLVAASLLEQLGAWLCLPRFMAAVIRDAPCHFHLLIDEPVTMALWRLPNRSAGARFRLRPAPLRSLLFPLIRKPVYDIRPLLCTLGRSFRHEPCTLLLRVDDLFLREKETVKRFTDVMALKKIPYAAGVTGLDLLDPANAAAIAELRGSGAEIAVHGFTHQGAFGPYASELLQMTFGGIAARLQDLAASAAFADGPPRIFIPPFNAISGEQIAFLGRLVDIVTGGPETFRFVDRFIGPVALQGGGWYVPAAHPYYGSARALLASGAATALPRVHGFVCICLHMTQEAADGFAGLSRLLDTLPVLPSPWRIFTKNKSGAAYFISERKGG